MNRGLTPNFLNVFNRLAPRRTERTSSSLLGVHLLYTLPTSSAILELELIETSEDEQSEDEVLRSENLCSENHSEPNGSEDLCSDLYSVVSELIVVSSDGHRDYSVQSESSVLYSVVSLAQCIELLNLTELFPYGVVVEAEGQNFSNDFNDLAML